MADEIPGQDVGSAVSDSGSASDTDQKSQKSGDNNNNVNDDDDDVQKNNNSDTDTNSEKSESEEDTGNNADAEKGSGETAACSGDHPPQKGSATGKRPLPTPATSSAAGPAAAENVPTTLNSSILLYFFI